MSNLNSWQKIDRVLNGQPFGNGSDGSYSSTTIPSVTQKSCSGSSGSTTLTIGSSGFSNGDIIFIYQLRGTGTDQFEVNKISSGGGTTSLTLQTSLHFTFTDSGASQALVTNIPLYSNINIASGTWTVPSWDGDVGGIVALACNGTSTFANTFTAKGIAFRGYNKANSIDSIGYTGEGDAGAGQTLSASRNGSGGGGGNSGSGVGAGGGGGGGGNSATGSTGATASPGRTGGQGGSSTGSSDLTSFGFGGAGGSGGGDDNTNGPEGKGGFGGGAIVLFTKDFVVTGSINASGNNGSNSSTPGAGGGGGGAGGSILIACKTATLGTTKITAVKGSGGSGNTGSGAGGAGADGRIAVHHSDTISGTTNPTFTNVSDSSLVESAFLGSMI